MTRPINYRCEHGSTDKTLKYCLRHIERLVGIHTIEGYRFASRRSSKGEDGERIYWRNTHEFVRITANNGKCLINACWGYGGAGPHALLQMLEKCRVVPKNIAEYVAFESPRNNKAGVDWKISVGPNGKITEVKFNYEKLKEAA